ncbi:MAG: nucleoside triphosphate pyrophosphohydrolase [Ignavibacteria bacterium]|nr:nucleoside triphosphate pyrophosphohydrolase [Ignavibacteria bacterium]
MENNKVEIPRASDPNNLAEAFLILVEIVKLLRKHCPWDRKQTNESIAPLLIEEAYETISAIETKNDNEFQSELGDLLLHIIMHSIMAEERNSFNLLDVINKIQEKLIFRHPHVFSSTIVTCEEDVVRNWEELKKSEGKTSALDGVPINLPSLLRAERIQHKASRVGFDWEKAQDVWNKVLEELNELQKAVQEKEQHHRIEEELGDLLFAIVNYARFLGVCPEYALQKTNNKFIQRFQAIEAYAKEQNKPLTEMTLEEMDKVWNKAKNNP